MRGPSLTILICATALMSATPGRGADDPPSHLSLGTSPCKSAEPATKPAPASADGTSPGNAGSTGWSGGLGGSTIGTSQNGPTPKSKSYQPAVAHGLDPLAAPPKPSNVAC